MNNWKQSIFLGMVAIIALSFGFVGCDDKDDSKQITREFSITVDGKDFTITVKDTRTGTVDVDLETLEIIDALAFELGEAKGHPNFNMVFGRTGFVIEVEDTDDYDYYKAYSATKLGFNFDFLKDPGVLLPTAIGMAINAMVDGATYPTQV
jgi:hypothetical protein